MSVRPSSTPPKTRRRSQAIARRAPQQERAQSTVEAILTASRRLVARDGVEKVTTNGIARLAGVSIGSLYQYFPSKRAIIMALRQQHQEAGERIFREEAESLIHAPVPVALRRFVEKMIEVHKEEPALHRALELEGRSAWIGSWERRAFTIVRGYLELHRSELSVTDLDQATMLVLITTESVTHGAVIERPDLLRDTALVDGLVRMLTAYLMSTLPEDPVMPKPSADC